MRALAAAALLLAALVVASCRVIEAGLQEVERGRRRDRVWMKPGAGQYELESDSAACRNEAGVGLLDEWTAARRWDDCMVGRGWRAM